MRALYLKWRPSSFEDMVGQEHVTTTLRHALQSEGVRHAYLFSGPRGTGKTSSARLLAKAMNCLDPDPANRPCNECDHCRLINEGRFLDLIEIDAASHTSVDDVRDLRDKVAFAPSQGKYKVYIIDEVHRFSGAAFDALLKTLEEPPEHAIFILATTEIDKVPATIQSRCIRFNFRRIPVSLIAGRLAEIVAGEGLQVEDGVLELVARQASGALRDAISLLDQLVANPGEIVTLEQAEAMLGTAGSGAVDDLVGALVGRDLADGLAIINRAIDEGADPRQFAHEVVERLRALLLIKTGAPDWVDATDEVRTWLADLAMTIAEGELLRAIRAFNGTIAEARSGWQPQLPLELALVEALQAPAVQVVEQSTASPSPAPPPTYGPRKSSQPASQPAPPQTAAAQPESAPQDASPTSVKSAPQDASKDGTLSLSRIQSEWEGFVKESRDYYHALQALLALCEPKAIEGNKLILLASRPFAKEKLEAADAFDGLLRAVEATFGQKFEVELVLPEAEGENTAPVSTTDPFIAALQQDGGQVVRVEKVEKSE